MTAEPKFSLYEVISNPIERMEIDEKGRFKKVVEVTARTASGIEFTEVVDKSKATPANLDKILSERAKALEGIRALRK